MTRRVVTFTIAGLLAGAIVGLIAAVNVGLLMGVEYEHTLERSFTVSLEGVVITTILVVVPIVGAGVMWRYAHGHPDSSEQRPQRVR